MHPHIPQNHKKDINLAGAANFPICQKEKAKMKQILIPKIFTPSNQALPSDRQSTMLMNQKSLQKHL